MTERHRAAKTERDRAGKLLRQLRDFAKAKSDADRDAIRRQVELSAAELLSSLAADLSALHQQDPGQFVCSLRRSVQDIEPQFIAELVADPAELHGDLATLDAQWQLPDEAFLQAKTRAEELLGSGAAVEAFLVVAKALISYYSDYLRAEQAIGETGKSFARENAAARREALGALAPFKAVIPKLSTWKLVEDDKAKAITVELLELEQIVRNAFPLLEPLVLETEPYERMLGDNLMRLFASVGFVERRGRFTRTRAAYFCAALAAQEASIQLASNTVRLARGELSSLHRRTR